MKTIDYELCNPNVRWKIRKKIRKIRLSKKESILIISKRCLPRIPFSLVCGLCFSQGHLYFNKVDDDDDDDYYYYKVHICVPVTHEKNKWPLFYLQGPGNQYKTNGSTVKNAPIYQSGTLKFCVVRMCNAKKWNHLVVIFLDRVEIIN